MKRNTVYPSSLRQYDPKALHLELYNRSIVLSRSAHELTSAADQLLRAHRADSVKSAADVRTAAFAAMLAALSACELVGGYELAGWLERMGGAAPRRG